MVPSVSYCPKKLHNFAINSMVCALGEKASFVEHIHHVEKSNAWEVGSHPPPYQPQFHMNCQVLLPFQIIRRFGFSRYVALTMYLDIVYI
jgi:hypothetical protein